jgi:membrane-associated protein
MFNLVSFIQAAGYIGIFCITFAESGILLGFFLPGDTMLFTAGFLAYKGILDYWPLVIITFLAAVLGDSFGYSLGRKFGPSIFKKEDNSIFFHKDQLDRAKRFYEKHGGKTIILARFMPIIRTLAPVLAGVGRMKYSNFLFYNLFGGALWVLSLISLGFYLGNIIPNVEYYIWPIITLIVIISISPTLIHIIKNKDYRLGIIKYLNRLFTNFARRRKEKKNSGL